jgi:RNA polymerase sigma-70 factor (ECF subfamily)
MRAYKGFGRYDPQQPFWQWIAAIANNHCIDVIRRRSRTEALFGPEAGEIEALSAEEPPMLTRLISVEEAGTLNDAIGKLPDKYRIPVVLAYFNQSSYDEIAEQLEISRNHVGVLLLRAKQRLRADLGAGEGGQ